MPKEYTNSNIPLRGIFWWLLLLWLLYSRGDVGQFWRRSKAAHATTCAVIVHQFAEVMIFFGFVRGKLALLFIRLYPFEIFICIQYSTSQLMLAWESLPFRGVLIVVWRVRRRRGFVRIDALALLAKQFEYHFIGFGVFRLRSQFDSFLDELLMFPKGLGNSSLNILCLTRILMTHSSLGVNL